MEGEIINTFKSIAKDFGLDGALIASIVMAVNLLKDLLNLEKDEERAKKWKKIYPVFALVLSVAISGFYYNWANTWMIVFTGAAYFFASTCSAGTYRRPKSFATGRSVTLP